MKALRRILLVVNPNRRLTNAYRQAAGLALATGAELHLVLFEHDRAIEAATWLNGRVGALARKAYFEERQVRLQELCLELHERGLRSCSRIVWDTPTHIAVVREVQRMRADVVIKDVAYAPLIPRLLFKPLDWKLLRLCPAPLWLVKGGRPRAVKRVVAAVDAVRTAAEGGALNDRIVETARRFADYSDAAALDVVHVKDDSLLDPQAELGGMFETFANKHGINGDARHCLQGLVSEAVARFSAERNAGLVVVGTTYRTGLQRILMGSMAEMILTRVDCDVLAIKPPGFEKDLVREIGAPVAAPRRRAA